jgi:anti-sigma regulatory factor (Ser/Thr protein kinase)
MVTAPGDESPYLDRARGVTSLTLDATVAAVSSARRFARSAVTWWGLGVLAEDAELVVSELAANAVRASGAADPPDARGGDPGPLATIQLRVLAYQAGVVVEVWDSHPGSPVRRDPVPDQEGGRGLVIIAALCREWGCFHTAEGDKVVWAELVLPAGPLTPARLPRRAHSTAAAAAPAAGLIRDPVLLRQVRDGLKNL